MTSRWYKKQQTRLGMLNAGLHEISIGRSFDSLSLREVTRAAGIAPTTFYRHFSNMEEYGQGLIEAAAEVIADDAKKVREALKQEGESVRFTVETLISAMQESPGEYRLLLNLRMGSSQILRAAANRVLADMGKSVAAGLGALSLQRRRPVAEVELAAEAIVSLIWGRAGDIMAPLHKSPEALTSELFTAVRLILIGAEQPLVKREHRQIA